MKDCVIALLLVLLALSWAGQTRGPEAQIDGAARLHHADFPLCVTIHNGPLLRSPENQHDFRLGRPFNDKGAA